MKRDVDIRCDLYTNTELFDGTIMFPASISSQNIPSTVKGLIVIGAVFNDNLVFCFSFCETETDESLLTGKLFCNVIFDDGG